MYGNREFSVADQQFRAQSRKLDLVSLVDREACRAYTALSGIVFKRSRLWLDFVSSEAAERNKSGIQRTASRSNESKAFTKFEGNRA